MRMLRRIWKDESGFVVSTELVLIATILVIGMITGLVSVRDQVVQELEDVAVAIGNINQSYEYYGLTGCAAATSGSDFTDELDWCERPGGLDPTGLAPPGIVLAQPAIEENEPVQKPHGGVAG